MAEDKYGFDKDKTYTAADNPFWDSTEGAHPAWWRGSDAGCEAVVDIVNKILDGEHDGRGTYGSSKLEALKKRLINLRKRIVYGR